MDHTAAVDTTLDTIHPAPNPAVPELLLPVCLLLTVLVAIELMIGSPFFRTQSDSARAAQVAALGFAPWIYIAYVAGCILKAAESRIETRQSNTFVWLELFCLALTVTGEAILTWLLIRGTGASSAIAIQNLPPALIMLSFAAPFLLGIPACFAYSLRVSQLLGATRAGIMPGMLVAVGLLQPFTMLGASATALLLIGGPQAVVEWGPVPLCVACAALGCLLSTLGLETLRLSLLKKCVS